MKLVKGYIIEIPVHNEFYVYAQMLQKGYIAYFDTKYSSPVNDVSDVCVENVLFVLGSSISNAINSGRWKIIGKLPIGKELKSLPMQFIQDAIIPTIFSLYNCENGEISRTTREHCEGLERCAVWYDNHIEDRIYAHYTGTKCPWLISIDAWIALNSKS